MTNGKYRILSISGGGVRGIVAAIWLNRLEKKLGSPIWQHFDLIAGTSTGAVIGCALSLGIDTETVVDFYLHQSRTVFPTSAARLWSRLRRTLSEGLDAPRYDGEGLARVLKQVFGDARLSDLRVKPTLITTYNTVNREALVLKNDRPHYNSLRLWDVCKASSSAPVYFPAHLLQVGNQELPLIDGGIVANNPTACAIAEGVRINKARSSDERIDLENFVVASFGTGEVTRPIYARQTQEWGALEWVMPLIDVLFDGSADAVDYIAHHLLTDGNYFRFQTPLNRAYDDIDNADATNLSALITTAQDYLTHGGDALLDKLVLNLQ
ncbi:patatin-like phospholipase family protein [Oculatella sp. LEGE 06141]|uniref:patatin-like phospholipase family protein n=1 Tax=Oculatella sp. LEGE 06141 TaxID=1828648 RepID=UPI001881F96E|nr:patatin-like phospholipase family protein [Oculatella sp. LEGE 06141]MBE9182166.1 patatin-like phospholipase family protein [Oculatella sp. LEGE 06141]